MSYLHFVYGNDRFGIYVFDQQISLFCYYSLFDFDFKSIYRGGAKGQKIGKLIYVVQKHQ